MIHLIWLLCYCFLFGLPLLVLLAIREFTRNDEADTIPIPHHEKSILGHAACFHDTRKVLQVLLKWFAEVGDVFQIWLAHRRVVVSAEPRDCFEILSNTFKFARPEAQTRIFELLQSRNLQTMDRVQHKLDRQEIRAGLDRHMIASFSPKVNQACRSLIDDLKLESERENMPVDITPKLADTTSRILFEGAFGLRNTNDQFRAYFAFAGKALLGQLFWEIIMYPLGRLTALLGGRKRLFRYHRNIQNISKNILESYSQQNDATVSLLEVIAKTHGCREDRERCAGLVSAFSIAGFESSSEAITWALYELIRNSNVLEKVRSELDSVLGNETVPTYETLNSLPYLRACWKETLRLHPATGFLLRVAKRDNVLPGSNTEVKKGTQVGVLIAGAHRHPKYFKRPNEFIPERWLSGTKISRKAQLAFSAGLEDCPGKGLANFEGPAILGALIKSFDIKLACNEEDVQQISDWTDRARTRGPGKPEGDLSWSIPLIFEPRNRC